MRSPRSPGFTLVELLIVVAIIAILAAIAVPNFLEAQTRAKVTRAKSDLRTLATALESYNVDHNSFPPSEAFLASPDLVRLSTPVAYLSSLGIRDPFASDVAELPAGPTANPDGSYAYVAYEPSSRFFQFQPPT